ncbi:MAG: hypothetical protein AB3N14_05545 [Flavobacteriaceae bacterium]
MKRYCFLMGILLVISCSKDETPSPETEQDSRSFYMGFTGFPYDNTSMAQLDTYEQVTANSDIFLNHLDHGVPWDEAFNDLPFPTEVQSTLDATKTGLKPNTKILLTATPTDQQRENLARYWNNNGSHQPLPAFWETKALDDPDVITAYLKYCRRIINEVQPDYFAYGIEVTAAFRKEDAKYAQFLVLMETVYTALKLDYPDLPIFLTFQDRSFNNTHAELLEVTSELLEFSDYMAISTYPFLNYQNLEQDANPALFSDSWLADFQNLDLSKPVAISETGFCAEDLVIENLGVNVKGSANWQKDYLTKLFVHANEMDAEFVAWFVYRDYDLLYDKTANPTDIFKVWKDNGLLDGEGNKRPAHTIWDQWKALPVD